MTSGHHSTKFANALYTHGDGAPAFALRYVVLATLGQHQVDAPTRTRSSDVSDRELTPTEVIAKDFFEIQPGHLRERLSRSVGCNVAIE
jgi:hypothetical protein